MNANQEEILGNYRHPQNFGKPTWEPTHYQNLQNLACGDEIEIFLKIKNNIVSEISFLGEGCSIAIATTSILTSKFKGKSVQYVLKFSHEMLIKLLGIELTPFRVKCAFLGLEAIKKAIEQEQSRVS